MKYINKSILCFLLFIFVGNSFLQAQSDFIGKQAPELKLEHLIQCPYNKLNWKLLKDKIVVLEFWATWCAPCVASIPHINKLSKEFKNKNVVFISITDEPTDKIKRFLNRRPMNSWIGIDSDRSLFKALKVQGIPVAFVINKSGIIISVMHPSQLTSDKLSSFLKQGKIATHIKKNFSKEVPKKIKKDVSSDKVVKKPLFEFKIFPTKSQEYPFYAYNPSIGEFNAKAISIRETISLLYDFPSFLIFGQDSILNKWYKISLKVPKYKINSFTNLFKKYLNDALELKVGTDSIKTDVYIVKSFNPNLLVKSNESNETHFSSVPGLVLGTKISLDDLFQKIQSIIKKPIINKTGLNDSYNWDIEYDKNNPQTLIKLLSDKYGLNFNLTKRKIKVLVVKK